MNQSILYIYIYSGNCYSVRALIKYLTSEISFIKKLEELKKWIIKQTIGKYCYKIIDKKVKFYYLYGNTMNTPPESCYDYLYRATFSHYPEPYKCDYFIQTPTDKSKDEMIVALRQKFGYAYRCSSTNMSRSSSRFSNTNRTFRNKEKSGISMSSNHTKKASIVNHLYPNALFTVNTISIDVIDQRKTTELDDDIHS